LGNLTLFRRKTVGTQAKINANLGKDRFLLFCRLFPNMIKGCEKRGQETDLL